jgi:hypothetical protein
MPADSRRAEWIADSAVPLGRDLYEDLPVHERPVWAARVLGTCLRHLDLEVSALDEVYDVATDPKRWLQARDAFDAVRRLVLEEEEAPQHGL